MATKKGDIGKVKIDDKLSDEYNLKALEGQGQRGVVKVLVAIFKKLTEVSEQITELIKVSAPK